MDSHPRSNKAALHKPVRDLYEYSFTVTRHDRERIKGHSGKVIWFTGLSGSGKSTLANLLEVELNRTGLHTYILDGDNTRLGLNSDLGFSMQDRAENIRRIAEVAKLMMEAGLIVMTAFISPSRKERELARTLIGTEDFIEVYVDTSLEQCEARDPKGLYKRARAGLITNMTGISSPYEPPIAPQFIATSKLEATENVRRISSLLESLQQASTRR